MTRPAKNYKSVAVTLLAAMRVVLDGPYLVDERFISLQRRHEALVRLADTTTVISNLQLATFCKLYVEVMHTAERFIYG